MGGAEVCDTATRFDWISEVWVARFRGFAPTATVVPALRAFEPRCLEVAGVFESAAEGRRGRGSRE